MVGYIYTPPKPQPRWTIADIKVTKIQHFDQSKLGNKPLFDADLMKLFVVELGDHSAALLNGDTFEPIMRCKTRFALHGGPKHSPDGLYVYFASRDGWISKYDIYNMKIVPEVRAGINKRNLAVSSDGKYAIVGNYLPHNVVILDTEDLSPIKTIPTIDSDGVSSRVSAVYNAPPRNSFIVALKDVKDVWEIPYSNKVGVILDKDLVHDDIYIWVDVFFGPNKDKVHVINKSTLEIVKTLTPVPGKTAAHVEFTKDGQYVLLSIWGDDGALIVYNAITLEEMKRLPMKKPSGKYNVFNKINYEKGTSH